jgi:hypothetical protein
MMSGVAEPGRPWLPERSEDGTDLTLIRWMLSLTPAERLETLDDYLNEMEEIRERNCAAPEYRNS